MIFYGSDRQTALKHGMSTVISTWFTRLLARRSSPTDQFLRLYDNGRFDEALPLIEAIVAAAPDIPTSWLNLGATLAALDRPVEASEAYLCGSKLSPTRDGLYLACHVLAQAGESEALLTLFIHECRRDSAVIGLCASAEVFKPYFAQPGFQELRRRYE